MNNDSCDGCVYYKPYNYEDGGKWGLLGSGDLMNGFTGHCTLSPPTNYGFTPVKNIRCGQYIENKEN
jgi:hypothetical protein